MPGRPAITALLNGHAVKVGFGSTSLTSNWGSARRSARAQVAPPKPPPMTTMRSLPWPSDSLGESATAVAAPGRKWRLVVLLTTGPPPFRSPGGRGGLGGGWGGGGRRHPRLGSLVV